MAMQQPDRRNDNARVHVNAARSTQFLRTQSWLQARRAAVLISDVPPLLLRTANNRSGLPISSSDEIRAAVLADRSQFLKDLTMAFYG
jgi:hypothetical protein